MPDNCDVKISNHKFIVFSGEHYNPLGVVRSLGEIGRSPILIVLKGKIKITSKSKYLSCVHTVDSVEEGYKLLLDKYGNENPHPFVYTCDDLITSYLDTHYDELHDRFYFFNAGKPGQITKYMDKDQVCNLAKKHGLNIPRDWVVNRGEIPKDLEYPIITKSISSIVGGWKNDVFICHNDNELLAAFEKIQSSVVLLQEYITKKNELCLDGVCTDHGKKMLITAASTYNYIIPNGHSSYMTVRNFNDAELKRKISGMMQEVGFEGIFSVDFIIGKHDELYFLEINYRNSAWSYASTKAGMNLPYLWAKAVLNNGFDTDDVCVIPHGFTSMNEFTVFNSRVVGRQISLAQFIKDVKECNCLFNYNKLDKKPFYTYMRSKIKQRIWPVK